MAYRGDLVDQLHGAVIELNDDSFLVKRHLRYVEIFRTLSAWNSLETMEISDIKEHIAPLIKPKKEDELARRFDYLVYSIDLGLLQYLDKIRRKIYYTNFTDTIIDSTEGEPIYGGNDLKNYRKKVEFYLKEHSDRLSVYKLRNNKKLSEADLKELERILWTELGSKDDYIKEYGDTPIGRLVRQIVGVDRAAVNVACSEFLTEERLNLNQMRFVILIVDYIAANGNIDDNKVLMGEPFKSVGSITSLFKDDMGTAKQIIEVVALIKRNSEEIA